MTLEFERATVYEGAQIGVESTPGTAVPADKRLLGVQLELDNMMDIKTYRPQGSKAVTTSQRGKEWTQIRLTGIQCYNDMVYLARSWINCEDDSPGAAKSNVFVTSALDGTFGFTYKGEVLAPITPTDAATLQAAIEGMDVVGEGNVFVTGTSLLGYTIAFIGPLLLDDSDIGTLTGDSATLTVTRNAEATLAKHWVFKMENWGPDDVATFTIEKGVQGVDDMAQQAAFGFVTGLQFKNSPAEASFTGDMSAQTTTDPFDMTEDPDDVDIVPVDPDSTGIFIGTGLDGTLQREKRLLDIEFGAVNKAEGLMTIDETQPSFSNRIETATPQLTAKWFMEHNSAGQAMLARVRAGTKVFVVLQSIGPEIETGYNYIMKWTMCVKLVKPDTQDQNNAYGKMYNGELAYHADLGTPLQLEIVSPLTGL